MRDVNQMSDLARRRWHRLSNHRRLDCPSQEEADLENLLLWPNEKITDASGEHDAVMRRVNALFPEVHRGFPQALPGVHQVFGEIGCQRPLGRGPTIVLVVFFDDLMAVVAFLRRRLALWPLLRFHVRYVLPAPADLRETLERLSPRIDEYYNALINVVATERVSQQELGRIRRLLEQHNAHWK